MRDICGRHLLQDLNELGGDGVFGVGDPGQVPAGSRKVCHETLAERVADADEDGRDFASLRLDDARDAPAGEEDHVRLKPDELGRGGPHAIEVVRRPAFVEAQVDAGRPAEPAKLILECGKARSHLRIAVRVRHQDADLPDPIRLLRPQ